MHRLVVALGRHAGENGCEGAGVASRGATAEERVEARVKGGTAKEALGSGALAEQAEAVLRAGVNAVAGALGGREVRRRKTLRRTLTEDSAAVRSEGESWCRWASSEALGERRAGLVNQLHLDVPCKDLRAAGGLQGFVAVRGGVRGRRWAGQGGRDGHENGRQRRLGIRKASVVVVKRSASLRKRVRSFVPPDTAVGTHFLNRHRAAARRGSLADSFEERLVRAGV